MDGMGWDGMVTHCLLVKSAQRRPTSHHLASLKDKKSSKIFEKYVSPVREKKIFKNFEKYVSPAREARRKFLRNMIKICEKSREMSKENL